MADVSIMITGKDNLSSVLKKLSETTNTYKKDLNGLDDKLQDLTKTQGNLAAELTESKKALSDAQKAFKATGDEADKMRVAMEQTKVDKIKQNMRAVSAEMKSTERDMQSLTSSASKMDTQLSQIGTTANGGLMKTLVAAGLGNMLGSSAAGLAGTLVTSALGSTAGGMVTSTVSGAVSGAALGSIAGLPGMAIGGLFGALSGAIEGLTKQQEKLDEAFRSYMQESYGGATDTLQSAVTSGSATSASREMYQISFNASMGEEAGQAFYESMKTYAEKTPFEFDPLVSVAQQLLPAFGSDAQDMMTKIQSLGNAASALGKSESDMSEMARALTKMQQTGKATQEYISMLTERGVPALDYLASALGGENGPLATADIYDMMSKGKISGADAVEIIVKGMSEQYAGATEKAGQTYTGKSSTLQDAWANIYNAAGEGYNEVRMEGIEEELAWLDENGDDLKEAYRQWGEYKAQMDNLQSQTRLNAYDNALKELDKQNTKLESFGELFGTTPQTVSGIGGNFGLSDEDIAAMMDGFSQSVGGASVYGLLGQAIMEGDAGFYSSDVYSEFVGENVDMINAMQGNPDVSTASKNVGYYIAEELTKGTASKLRLTMGSEIGNSVLGLASLFTGSSNNAGTTGNGYAVGLPRVPYDNFPALLHEGEAVLTAQQARSYQAGGGGGVVITGNSFTVREEADIYRIASALYNQIKTTAASFVG